MKRVLLLVALAVPAVCQPVSFGVKAGVPLDKSGYVDGFRTTLNRERWTVGPTVEFRLSRHFFLGADALYRRLNYSSSRNTGSIVFSETSTTDHWEVPIFAKFRFSDGPVRPFVTGGVAAEHASVNGTVNCSGDALLCGPGAGRPQALHSDSWGGGWLIGGGVEFSAGRLKIAPEFRYTRWLRGYFSGAGTDQPALLVGIRF